MKTTTVSGMAETTPAAANITDGTIGPETSSHETNNTETTTGSEESITTVTEEVSTIEGNDTSIL